MNEPEIRKMEDLIDVLSESKENVDPVKPDLNFIKKDHFDSNMLVAIRLRPLSARELMYNDFEILSVEDKLIIVLDPKELEYEGEGKRLDVLHRCKEQRYFFDRIFSGNSSQEDVYSKTCLHLIEPLLQGYNATVFAYGTTGSGKTYTMVGTHDNPGIMALTIRDIFTTMSRDKENEYDLKVSYVEIYNEVIRDLLVFNSKDTYLDLRDDPIKGITIAGVTEVKVEDSKQIMSLLNQGNKRRTTEATNANQTSSRSHAVFQIVLTSRSRTKNTNIELLCGKLSLIDLAGSERGSVTENRGMRLREGAKINTSLLALANCINSLGDKSKKGFFVPFRDSKLTRLLKDSLGGNCKTVMITTISPASSQYEETVNTLKYANRAKNIKTKAVSNKKMVTLHISAYKNIINELRDEIERLKTQIAGNNKTFLVKELENANIKANESQNQIKKETTCSCGRLNDEPNKIAIQNEISQVYDDIMQLEQSLIELDEQNTQNAIEIKTREAKLMLLINTLAELMKCKSSEIDKEIKPDDPQEIKNLKSQIERQMSKIEILKENTKKNIEKRHSMKNDLLDSYEIVKKIRNEITIKIKVNDVREFLELFIKNNFLESQNIQLLLNLQLQSRTIADLKSMISRQQQFINENCLGSKSENFKKQLLGDTHEFPLGAFQAIKMPIDNPVDLIENQHKDFEESVLNEINSFDIQPKRENIKEVEEPQENEDKEENSKSDLPISIQGISAFKGTELKIIEGPSNKGKIIKKSTTKENKSKPEAKIPPADLSIMGNKVQGKQKAPILPPKKPYGK